MGAHNIRTCGVGRAWGMRRMWCFMWKYMYGRVSVCLFLIRIGGKGTRVCTTYSHSVRRHHHNHCGVRAYLMTFCVWICVCVDVCCVCTRVACRVCTTVFVLYITHHTLCTHTEFECVSVRCPFVCMDADNCCGVDGNASAAAPTSARCAY